MLDTKQKYAKVEYLFVSHFRDPSWIHATIEEAPCFLEDTSKKYPSRLIGEYFVNLC